MGYVALAQRKEDRKAHLAQQYVQRVSGMRMQQGQFGQMGQQMAQQMGQMGFPQQQYFLPAAMPQQGQRHMQPNFGGAPQMGRGGQRHQNNRMMGGRPMGPNPMAMPMNMPNMAAIAQARPGMPPNAAAQAGARPNFKCTSGVRNVAGAPVMPGQQQPQMVVPQQH